jgi:phospholipid transport system substrate-binding protein
MAPYRKSFVSAVIVSAWMLMWFGAAGTAAAIASETPEQAITGLNAQLLATMKQADQLGVQGRFKVLAPILLKTYDIPSMSRMAVGQSWASLQPAQQAAVTDGFSRMMIATYAKRFDGFSGETFKIVDISDRPPNAKMVKTVIVQSNGKPVAINYLMRKTGSDWRVFDVYLDGTISELASRRAEFTSILRAGGPDALILSLRKQGDKLLSGG